MFFKLYLIKDFKVGITAEAAFPQQKLSPVTRNLWKNWNNNKKIISVFSPQGPGSKLTSGNIILPPETVNKQRNFAVGAYNG